MPFTIHLISLVLTLIALVLSLGIIWQSESSLDRAFRFLTISLIATALNELLQIIVILGAPTWAIYSGYIQLVALIFLTIFLYSFTQTLQNVWKKKK